MEANTTGTQNVAVGGGALYALTPLHPTTLLLVIRQVQQLQQAHKILGYECIGALAGDALTTGGLSLLGYSA